MVELALYSSAFLLVLFGGLQLALILNAAMAVSQYSYSAARYAAVHEAGNSAATAKTDIQSNVTTPPTINDGGLTTACNGSTGITVTIPSTDTTLTSGHTVTVQVNYNTSVTKRKLPSPFFGSILPTCVSNTSTLMVE